MHYLNPILLSICFLGISSRFVCAEPLTALCVVRELDDVEVPARREGLIKQLTVRRGTRVTNGQLLAALDSRDTELRLAVTIAELRREETKAENDGEVLAAQAGVDRARQELRLMNELGDDAVYLERFRVQNSLTRATAELRTASSRQEESQLMVDVKRNEVAVLENDIDETVVVSPVAGVVRELFKNESEWVQKGDPILVVTRMDRLQVEGFLDSRQIAPSDVVGASITVAFSIGGSDKIVFEGLRVTHEAPKLELDGKFPVWVEFDNRLVSNKFGEEVWQVRPGMKANMTIDVSSRYQSEDR